MRITVRPGSCVSTGLSNVPSHSEAHSILIHSVHFNEGGQGKIYKVDQIDGRGSSDLVLKLFDAGIPSTLKQIAAAVRDGISCHNIRQVSSLRALPLFLFEGTASGHAVMGYVMREVPGRAFSEILEGHLDDYLTLSLNDRLDLCRQFVEGMWILYALTIVHADLNGQNLMIDLSNRTLAIIDVDGGAVARSGSVPIVVKQEPGWLAPEIFAQLSRTIRAEPVFVSMEADLWSIASGVHYLLFGMSPFFFIANQPDIPEYLRRYQWPEHRGVHTIATRNHHAFRHYEDVYSQVPDLHRMFFVTFQEGYENPSRRIAAYTWLQVISGVLKSTGHSERRSPVKPQPEEPAVVSPLPAQPRRPVARPPSPLRPPVQKPAPKPPPPVIPFGPKPPTLVGQRRQSSFTVFAVAAIAAILGVAIVAVMLNPDVTRPSIETFTVNPATLQAGEHATIRWVVRNAGEVRIDNGIGIVATSGNIDITPPMSTVYRLTATSSVGTIEGEAVVAVAAPPPPPPQEKTAADYVQEANVLYENRQYLRAIDACDKALVISPDDQEATRLKAQIRNTIEILNGSK